MTLDYIYLPIAILKLPDMPLRQKLLLGLIVSFNEKGLFSANEKIGELLGVSACRVSHILASLEKSGYIRIENRQSRFRKIYFVPNSKVAVLLCPKQQSKNDSTLSFPQSTLSQTTNITKGTKYKHIHKTKKPVCASKDSSRNNPQESFERFWATYPKKVAQKNALKAWEKISPDERLFDSIMSALEIHRQQDSWIKDNGRYIPNPATWLSAERWTDVIAEPEYTTHPISEEEADKLMEEVQLDN